VIDWCKALVASKSSLQVTVTCKLGCKPSTLACVIASHCIAWRALLGMCIPELDSVLSCCYSLDSSLACYHGPTIGIWMRRQCDMSLVLPSCDMSCLVAMCLAITQHHDICCASSSCKILILCLDDCKSTPTVSLYRACFSHCILTLVLGLMY